MIEIPHGWTNVINHACSRQYVEYVEKIMLNGLGAGGTGRKESRQPCYFSAAHPREHQAVLNQKVGNNSSFLTFTTSGIPNGLGQSTRLWPNILPNMRSKKNHFSINKKGTEVNKRTAELYKTKGHTYFSELLVMGGMTQRKICEELIGKKNVVLMHEEYFCRNYQKAPQSRR